MSDCLPCDLESADAAAIVYRDDLWACEVAEGYDVPGWFILRVRRHAEGWSALTPDEAAAFGLICQRLSGAITAGAGATGAYFMSFGENYPHLHFLVTARPAELAPELRGAGILALRGTDRDLAASLAVAADVRAAFAASSP